MSLELIPANGKFLTPKSKKAITTLVYEAKRQE